MDLSASQEFASRVQYLEEIGSTNTYLLEQAKDSSWPDFSVVVTDNQTSGRGRLNRVWEASKGKALAVSVLVRPVEFGIEKYSWFPLMAGLAMHRTVSSLIADADVGLKWPNDVQVNGEKISGILAEVTADGQGVVIGAGLNLSQTKEELPIPNATSLELCGVSRFSLDDVLVRYLAALKNLYLDFSDAAGDASASGLLEAVIEASSTIGRQVEVSLPDKTKFTGTAAGIDTDGRLLVAIAEPTEIRAVAAGDIEHLRQ
jgi:BirA family biotin operon repressor/biotin-[acetyl-CoA-carboxylase] ligase